MIDIEQTILNIIDAGGGHELMLTRAGAERDLIVARTTGIHATWSHKMGTGRTVQQALIEVADKLGAEAPIQLLENLCDVCGLGLDPDKPFDGHPECREQE